MWYVEFIFIFFLSLFCKNIWSARNFANYTTVAVAHDGRDITSWPTAVGTASSGPVACDRHNDVAHDVRDIAQCATTLCPSAVGHGGSRAASAVPHDARICLSI
jgi:hypothetical protein